MVRVASRPAGTGDTRALPEILSALCRTGATGNLQVTASVGIRQLLFANGKLRALRSSVEAEKLGTWLVERGAIGEDHKALGLLLQIKETASPLGRLLITRGCVEQAVLEEQLEALAATIIERATTDRRLEIVFFEGGTGVQPDTLLRTPTPQLILVSARAFADLRAKRRFLGPLDAPVSISMPLRTIVHELRLIPAETDVLMTLQHEPTTLSDLTSYGSHGKEEILSAIYSLAVAGVVRLGHQANDREKPRPAAPVAKTAPNRKAATGTQAVRVEASPAVPPDASAPASASERDGAIQSVLDRVEELVQLGNVPGAASLLEKACEDHAEPLLMLRLAQLMFKHHMQPEKALDTLGRALETDPKLLEGWLELARFWRRNGHRERERKAIERVLIIEPGHQEARSRLAQLTDG